MRGVILAGGRGTRLLPATKILNKHLLPLGVTPMIEFPIRTLRELGISEILLVSGGENIGGFAEYLNDGSDFGVSLTYRIQKEAGGIAHALHYAESFSRGESTVVILGDNIFERGCFKKLAARGLADKAEILLKKVEKPERFGVARFSRQKELLEIMEKPKNPPSRFAVTGLYQFPPDVFDVIRGLKPSKRGELEITDVNNHYIKAGRMRYRIFDGFWSDAGTHNSLMKTAMWLYRNSK